MTDISNTNQHQLINEIKSANSNKICRACLSPMCSADTGNYLFDVHNLADKFVSCCSTLIMLNINDNLPKKLCNDCKIKLNSFYEFQQMCLASDKYLRELNPENVSVTQSSPLEFTETDYKMYSVSVKQEADVDFENDFEHMNTPSINEDVKEPQFLDDPLDEQEKIMCTLDDTAKINIELEDHHDQSNIKRPSLPIKCQLCPKQFLAEHSFEAHQRVHQGLVAYTCSYVGCDKGFKTKTHLDVHVQKIHMKERTIYSCKEFGCEKIFSTRTSFSLHMQDVHNTKAKPDLHICEVCGKCLSTASNLKLHRYTHDKTKYRFICTESGCQKRFADRSNFNVHMRRHAGIKKYNCPYCGVYKTSSTELKTHINIHTREIAC